MNVEENILTCQDPVLGEGNEIERLKHAATKLICGREMRHTALTFRGWGVFEGKAGEFIPLSQQGFDFVGSHGNISSLVKPDRPVVFRSLPHRVCGRPLGVVAVVRLGWNGGYLFSSGNSDGSHSDDLRRPASLPALQVGGRLP